MTVQTVDTLPPVTADHDPVRCLLAIELSKKSWIVAINTPLSDKISRYTLEACDWKGLLELMERVRTRVAREVGRPVEMISCYEAGYDGFWLHRLLEGQGVCSHVIDPGKCAGGSACTTSQDGSHRCRPFVAIIDGISAR